MAARTADAAANAGSLWKAPPTLIDIFAYQVDAWQRGLLTLDVMRKRSVQNEEQAAKIAPNVLSYEAGLICDGRTLERPVNYILAQIKPPAGVEIDETKRPFVVVDPRAGHGPGIGGFKADSEIGVAFRAGHPCYFVGFLPDPVPGQTILDIVRAEARFLEIVIERHPEAEAKPCVIGNCQAGWAVMMLAALRPELFGPIIIAGAPLSYWAGVQGQYPMRYSGGLLGGSWLSTLLGDLGNGVFDGAWLVQNFENQNPANTLWSKPYNLWSKADTEAERYLGFERWWGGHVSLNAEEMQFIVDELFVGNKLAAGEIRTEDGTSIDLRNIRSPIVVFCSKGDNITPPQQALDWILDLYDSVADIRRQGQTIVYTIHETVGHLGIFVSASVARKEHDEFASNIDLIEVLPPGLYEAVLSPIGEADANPDLVTGNWVMRCEARTLDDIRALGGNTLEDDRRFATAARVSEINLALYRAFAQPVIRAMANPFVAKTMREMHPLRLQDDVFGKANPFMRWIETAAERVKADRRPVSPDNSMVALQEQVSRQIVDALDGWRVMMERASERTFQAIYGLPALQVAFGVDPKSQRPARKAAQSLAHASLVEKQIEELRSRMGEGEAREALARSLIYIGLAKNEVDERGFAAIKRLRAAQPEKTRLPLLDFKAMIRDQYFMLLIDEKAALAAIPQMLPQERPARQRLFDTLEGLLSARGEITGERANRLSRIEALFDLEAERETPTPIPVGGRRSAAASVSDTRGTTSHPSRGRRPG